MHEQDVPGAVSYVVDLLKAPAQASNNNAQVLHVGIRVSEQDDALRRIRQSSYMLINASGREAIAGRTHLESGNDIRAICRVGVFFAIHARQ